MCTAAFNCHTANHTEVLSLLSSGEQGAEDGEYKITGARIKDTVNNTEFDVRAKQVCTSLRARPLRAEICPLNREVLHEYALIVKCMKKICESRLLRHLTVSTHGFAIPLLGMYSLLSCGIARSMNAMFLAPKHSI